jgi:hypothetical protein
VDLKEAEIAMASHRLLEAGRHAQQVFDPLKVRFYLTVEDGFAVSILLDNVLLAGFKGDQAMEVSDAVASFVIHLVTRVIEE